MFCLFTILTLAAGTPVDETTVKAKTAFESATKFYKQARYADAIAKFEEAYALKPHPSIYFNIGKCHEQLGDTPKALRSYRDYLRLSPNATDAQTVNDAIANMERRLREKGLQQLLVFAEPSTAHIEVDGKELGTSPSSVELSAGNHKLIVRAEGYDSVDRSFVMRIDRATEMTINLAKTVINKTNDIPAKEVPPTLVPDEPKENLKIAAVEPAPPKKTRIFTWVAAGAAVAAGGVGTAFGLINLETQNQMKKPESRNGNVNDLPGKLELQGTVANASFATAGVAAAAAIVLFFVEAN
jgi:hypothetical protein